MKLIIMVRELAAPDPIWYGGAGAGSSGAGAGAPFYGDAPDQCAWLWLYNGPYFFLASSLLAAQADVQIDGLTLGWGHAKFTTFA